MISPEAPNGGSTRSATAATMSSEVTASARAEARSWIRAARSAAVRSAASCSACRVRDSVMSVTYQARPSDTGTSRKRYQHFVSGHWMSKLVGVVPAAASRQRASRPGTRRITSRSHRCRPVRSCCEFSRRSASTLAKVIRQSRPTERKPSLIYRKALRRPSLVVRACVVSHAVPSIRNGFPSVSASTWPRTCTQRVLPSGQQTLYSARYGPHVLIALSTSAVTQAMSSG